MEETNKAKEELRKRLAELHAKTIIDNPDDSFRADGYMNMLTKYGTSQDSSTAYTYEADLPVDNMELIRLYEGNGLFAKIIDRPSEEAVKHGLAIDFGDTEISEYVEEKLDDLAWEDAFATAEKWARLYGGSIIVMLVDDGRKLEEPLDWNNVTKIEELRVFERAVVEPDWSSMYNIYSFADSEKKNKILGEPEYFSVFSIYGYFIVHASRCLVFRNGRLPEMTTNSNYRYWGIPEYLKIRDSLREVITAHHSGVKMMERSVQPIYKMKNLSNILGTDEGEDMAVQRLQVIDMARGILNTVAIDSDGEEYDFKTFTTTGVKEILDSTCNMLSAVTNIPQTVLFGRSPSGENATGESDLENYYNLIETIQKQNMKRNTRIIVDLIIKQGIADKKIKKEPTYKVKFAPLWSLSEADQIAIEGQKAGVLQAMAAVYNGYMQGGVLDPSEVRKMIAQEDAFDISEELPDSLQMNEEDLEMNEPQDESESVKTNPSDSEGMDGMNLDGGYGSGDWGHLGRPGIVGGSGGGGGADNRYTDPKTGAYTSFAKVRSAAAKSHQPTTVELQGYPSGAKMLVGGKAWTKGNNDRWTDADGNSLSSYTLNRQECWGKNVKVAIPKSGEDEVMHGMTKGAKGGNKAPSNVSNTKGFQPSYTAQRMGSAKSHDEKSADAAFRDTTAQIWNNATAAEKFDMNGYTRGSSYVNEPLRHTFYGGPRNDDAVRAINNITAAIDKSELKEDTILHRQCDSSSLSALLGTSINRSNISNIVGTTGKDDAFLSTGTGSDKTVGKYGYNVDMEIFCPAGTKALYMEPFSQYGHTGGVNWNGKDDASKFSDQQEMLLQRGTSVVVTEAKYDSSSGRYKVKVAVTGQDYSDNPQSRWAHYCK